jgi:hypothetical protein
MIKVTTTQAHAAELKRHRVAIAAQLAEVVEALAPEVCPHRDRPSCPTCSARRSFLAAARTVRETGGLKP